MDPATRGEPEERGYCLASYAREPRAYELMVILLPELAEEDLTGAQERVSKYISDATGNVKEILAESPWGRRRLAYTIRFNGQDYRDGNYAIWHFDLEPSRMSEIERELKLDTRVMRYLVVHDDPKWGPKNGGNQPPPGEEDDRGPRRPDSERRRPDGPRRPESERRPAPVAATAAAAPSTEAPAASTDDSAAPTNVESTEIVPVETASSDAVVTTDQSVATAENTVETPETVVRTTSEGVEAEPAAEAPGEPGAVGEETTAVVTDTTGAASEAPVEETADDSTNTPADEER